eukprot:4222178-Prymnesium_polylepis.1
MLIHKHVQGGQFMDVFASLPFLNILVTTFKLTSVEHAAAVVAVVAQAVVAVVAQAVVAAHAVVIIITAVNVCLLAVAL